ncbi:MAG: hypothetical protein ACRYFX_02685 [Janthinobacterium lividum]
MRPSLLLCTATSPRIKFTAVEISKLRTAFEETTGEDLQWFFDQWFLQRGHPELKITHIYTNGQVQLRVQQTQDTVFQPVFRLPVAVTVWQQNQATDHRITITKTDETFTLPASTAPSLVKFDSEAQLLAQLDETLSQEELLFQFYHARNYLQKYEALDLVQHKATDAAVGTLYRAALADKFYAVRCAALDHLRGFRGPNAAAIRAEVRRLATADPHPAVRAQALTTLATFASDDYDATYQAALRDSSYQVEAAAVAALAKKPSAAARSTLAALDNTTNSGLLVALADYYARHGSRAQAPWFLRHLPDLTDVDLYTYVQSLGDFLATQPVRERAQGVLAMQNLARTQLQYFVRIGAYQALSLLLPTQPDLLPVMLDIKNHEADERVKAAYNAM